MRWAKLLGHLGGLKDVQGRDAVVPFGKLTQLLQIAIYSWFTH